MIAWENQKMNQTKWRFVMALFGKKDEEKKKVICCIEVLGSGCA